MWCHIYVCFIESAFPSFSSKPPSSEITQMFYLFFRFQLNDVMTGAQAPCKNVRDGQ